MKSYISITGSTVAGKSTLLRALSLLDLNVYVVPQATCRQPRYDDDPNLFRYFDECDFDKQRFYVRFRQYGILHSDMERFINSDQAIGASINGPMEITQFKNSEVLKFCNVLVRHSETNTDEIAHLNCKVKKHFSPDLVEERLRMAKVLNRAAFFNKVFISTHIDLIVQRNVWLGVWVKEILSRINCPKINDDVINKKSAEAIKNSNRIEKFLNTISL